jgi:sugar lactone lactonase YvrE
MATKTSNLKNLCFCIILLGFSWGVAACSGDSSPEDQNQNLDSTPTVEATTFVSPINPVSPISQSTLPASVSSPTPVATYVLEINPVATLAGEVTLDGKKLFYITTPVYDPFTLTGMAANDQYIWLINNKTDSILALNPQTGETASAFPFPESMDQNPNILGLAWDGTNFWFAEANNKTIYQYDSAFKGQLNSFSITNHPGNIAWDGQSLWIMSREAPEIQNWSTKGELLKTYPVPGQELTGLAWGAGRLWYIDAAERVVRYWDPASGSAKVIITDALAAKSFGSLSWKDNSLLLLDDMGGRLLIFDIDEFNFIK